MSGSLFEDKQFFVILCACFIFSFLFLWALGGACLNPVNGSSCIAKGAFSFLEGVPIIGLFLPYEAWSSLMYFFAPIAGFVLAVVVIRWWDSYFETSEASGIWFLVIMVVVLLLGYYVNLSIYTGEAARLNSRGQVNYSLYFCVLETSSDSCSSTVAKFNQEFISQAQSAKASVVSQYIPVYFWGELRRSMFLVFVLGAIFGWLPLFARRVYLKYSGAKKD